MDYEDRLHAKGLFHRRCLPDNSYRYRGGMELKILVKQQSNGRVYYKPVRGGAASTQRSRPVSRDKDECRKEGRSAQRL